MTKTFGEACIALLALVWLVLLPVVGATAAIGWALDHLPAFLRAVCR